MSDFLSAMKSSSLLRAEALRAKAGEGSLRSRVASARPALPLALDPSGFDLIAEAKLASPSEGELAADGADVVSLAREMADSGAAGISVLTEPMSFRGDIAHLRMVSASVNVPVLRKDFIVAPIQVLEARVSGASGVLLMARLVTPAELVQLTDLALDLGMFVLLEVFDEADIELAAVVFDRDVLVGVNARDLSTLSVDRQKHSSLKARLPGHLPHVAESGLAGVEDAVRCARLGYRLALVGTSLVTSSRPGELTRAMVEAGRGAAIGVGP